MKTLEELFTEIRTENTMYSIQVLELKAELTQLKAQLKREQECVDFYCNPLNWTGIAIDDDSESIEVFPMSPEVVTGGKRARETQKMRGEK